MILFFLLAAIVVAGALGGVLLKNPIHCVLSLILFFFGIACLYILLQAEFIAAVQILIYVGAVATLALFAIMLTRQITGMELRKELGHNRWVAFLLACLVAASLLNAIRHQQFPPQLPPGRLTTEVLGREMVTTFVLPFEVVSILLTAVLVGAMAVAMEEAKKRRG